MNRVLYVIALGLLGAAVAHVAIILLLPRLSPNTSWNAVGTLTELNRPFEIAEERDGADATIAIGLDPFFRHIICRYDLAEGAARIHARVDVPLWTISVYDTLGASFFSANDRTSASANLDLAIVDDRQLRYVRRNAPEILSDSLIVPAGRQRGFVVARVFVPDDSWAPVADRFVDSIACESLDF